MRQHRRACARRDGSGGGGDGRGGGGRADGSAGKRLLSYEGFLDALSDLATRRRPGVPTTENAALYLLLLRARNRSRYFALVLVLVYFYFLIPKVGTKQTVTSRSIINPKKKKKPHTVFIR